MSVGEVSSLSDKLKELQKKFKDLETVRIPLVEDAPAKESCIDLLVDSLKQEPASTQCVFSCQAGLGRTTLGLLDLGKICREVTPLLSGMIIACQVKEIQICSELRKMAEMGIGISKETAEDLIQQKFEFPLAKSSDDDDKLLRGEFDVIKELLAKLPGAPEAKLKVKKRNKHCESSCELLRYGLLTNGSYNFKFHIPSTLHTGQTDTLTIASYRG